MIDTIATQKKIETALSMIIKEGDDDDLFVTTILCNIINEVTDAGYTLKVITCAGTHLIQHGDRVRRDNATIKYGAHRFSVYSVLQAGIIDANLSAQPAIYRYAFTESAEGHQARLGLMFANTLRQERSQLLKILNASLDGIMLTARERKNDKISWETARMSAEDLMDVLAVNIDGPLLVPRNESPTRKRGLDGIMDAAATKLARSWE